MARQASRERRRGLDQGPQGRLRLEVDHAQEAIDACLCWGWIDAVRKGLDEKSFLQRYTPRGKKSIWSQINVDNVARLIEAGRMTEHGLREVEAAKADGAGRAPMRVARA